MHGLQSCFLAYTYVERTPTGAQQSGVLGPNRPTVGVAIAAARCIIPVSALTSKSHRLRTAQVRSIPPNSMASTISPENRPLNSSMNDRSLFPPVNKIVRFGCRATMADASSTKRATGQRRYWALGPTPRCMATTGALVLTRDFHHSWSHSSVERDTGKGTVISG